MSRTVCDVLLVGNMMLEIKTPYVSFLSYAGYAIGYKSLTEQMKSVA